MGGRELRKVFTTGVILMLITISMLGLTGSYFVNVRYIMEFIDISGLSNFFTFSFQFIKFCFTNIYVSVCAYIHIHVHVHVYKYMYMNILQILCSIVSLSPASFTISLSIKIWLNLCFST